MLRHWLRSTWKKYGVSTITMVNAEEWQLGPLVTMLTIADVSSTFQQLPYWGCRVILLDMERFYVYVLCKLGQGCDLNKGLHYFSEVEIRQPKKYVKCYWQKCRIGNILMKGRYNNFLKISHGRIFCLSSWTKIHFVMNFLLHNYAFTYWHFGVLAMDQKLLKTCSYGVHCFSITIL